STLSSRQFPCQLTWRTSTGGTGLSSSPMSASAKNTHWIFLLRSFVGFELCIPTLVLCWPEFGTVRWSPCGTTSPSRHWTNPLALRHLCRPTCSLLCFAVHWHTSAPR